MRKEYGFKNRRVYWRVPDDVRAEIVRLVAHGASYGQITSQIPVNRKTIHRLVQPLGGVVRAERWEVSQSWLSIDQRIDIALGLAHGESSRCIAERIGRAPSTICREIKVNGGVVDTDRWSPTDRRRREPAGPNPPNSPPIRS